MNHAVHLALVLCLDRDAVTVVAHGNHGILKVAAVGAADHGHELAVYLVVGLEHGAADALQLRAGIVGNLLLGEDAAVDFSGQPRQGVSSSKYSSRVSVGVPPSAGPPPLGLGLSLSRASPLVVLSFPALP